MRSALPRGSACHNTHRKEVRRHASRRSSGCRRRGRRRGRHARALQGGRARRAGIGPGRRGRCGVGGGFAPCCSRLRLEEIRRQACHGRRARTRAPTCSVPPKLNIKPNLKSTLDTLAVQCWLVSSRETDCFVWLVRLNEAGLRHAQRMRTRPYPLHASRTHRWLHAQWQKTSSCCGALR